MLWMGRPSLTKSFHPAEASAAAVCAAVPMELEIILRTFSKMIRSEERANTFMTCRC